VEVKNLNSFHYMEQAIESEIRRQIRLYSAHPHEDPDQVISSGTYRFDVDKKETVLMRQKEAAEDYRYFPEPDLPPIVLTDAYIEAVRASLPELPYQRFKRYVSELLLPVGSAAILTNEKQLANYFEEALKVGGSPKNVCNWITVEFTGRFKDTSKTLLSSGILASHIGKLVHMIESGVITGKIAKSVADEMFASPGTDPEAIVKANPDYQPMQDTSSIEPLVDEVLAANPQSVADYKAGKARAFDYLVGQVMKLCKGKASPPVVNELLTKKLK
jgi:aspartyl-tRNA(Asn)/glutamyl-tRNA(Gln) amidotransferase subunit B